MTEFEIVDVEEIEFKTPAKKSVKKPAKVQDVDVPIAGKTGELDTIEASSFTQEVKDDYKALAGKPRIYEVTIETVDYNKSGRKINYSHTIKYPGWAEFFGEEA